MDSEAAVRVASFLRENPDWLASNPEIYRAMEPPVRVHDDSLIDHMAAMLRLAQAHAQKMAQAAEEVITARRTAVGLRDRIEQAVLSLVQSTDPIDCIVAEWPVCLGVDGISLCMEGWSTDARARVIPQGAVHQLLCGKTVCFREQVVDALLPHGEAAGLVECDVLISVPNDIGVLSPPALLALFARDRCRLEPMQGAADLAFLGRAVAAALRR